MMPCDTWNSDHIPGSPGDERVRNAECRAGLAACQGRIRVHTLPDEYGKLHRKEPGGVG